MAQPSVYQSGNDTTQFVIFSIVEVRKKPDNSNMIHKVANRRTKSAVFVLKKIPDKTNMFDINNIVSSYNTQKRMTTTKIRKLQENDGQKACYRSTDLYYHLYVCNIKVMQIGLYFSEICEDVNTLSPSGLGLVGFGLWHRQEANEIMDS